MYSVDKAKVGFDIIISLKNEIKNGERSKNID
jgi:hypothetical protein